MNGHFGHSLTLEKGHFEKSSEVGHCDNVDPFNSHAGGMAVAQPYGFGIKLLRNSISGTAP